MNELKNMDESKFCETCKEHVHAYVINDEVRCSTCHSIIEIINEK